MDTNDEIFFHSSDFDEDRMNYLNGKAMYHDGLPCPSVQYKDSGDERIPNREQFQAACGWNYAEWEDNYNAL